MAYATAEQLAAYLRRPVDAAAAELALDGVSAEVEAECGWHIAPVRSETITVDGSGAQVQLLPTLHMTALTAITEDGTPVDLTTVQWSAAGYLWRTRPWTRALRGVVPTITHGYPAAPAWLVSLVLTAAGRAHDVRPWVRQETAREVSVSYVATGEPLLTEQERALLARLTVPVRS